MTKVKWGPESEALIRGQSFHKKRQDSARGVT